MIIRPAQRSDVPALAALARKTYADAFGHSFAPADLAMHLREALSDAYFLAAMEVDAVFLAEPESGLVGFIQFGDVSSAEIAALATDQEIRRLYVLAEFQNQGVGTRLMDVALCHPRLRRAPNIYIDVWERNSDARRLYERHGFHVVGSKALPVASGVASEHDLIMVRRSNPEEVQA